MACNSKENTLNVLIKNEIIDNTRRVDFSKLKKFEALNKEYTNLAKEKYGISNGEMLFKVEKIKKNAIKGHNYHRNNSVTFYRVEPNETLFNLIDEEINKSVEVQDEPIDFFDSDALYESNQTALPDYERYILYKENLLRRLNDRLAKIEAEKKKYASNSNKLKELTKLENEIKTRVEGSEELDIIGLEQEILDLKSAPPIDKFNYYAEKDFNRLDKLTQSDNIEDLHEAKIIISFYESIGNFDINIPNPIFESEDIFDSVGKNILPKDIVQNFTELSQKAKSYENVIEQKAKKAVMDVINNNRKVKAVYDKEMNYDEVFFKDEGLKDTNWIDTFVMDITNGIFSHNGIVPQVMMNTIQNAFETNLVYAKSVENRVNDLQSEVEKELTKLGYSINIPGVKGVSYDLFRATDKNGQFKDSVTQRYTSKFIEDKSKMFNEFNTKLDFARLAEDPNKKQQLFQDAYAFRDNWYRKNTIVLDVSKISDIVNDSSLASFQQYFNKDDNYTQELKNLLGEQGYKEEIDKQIKLLRNYQTALDVFTDNLLAEAGLNSINEFSDVEKSKLEMWIKRNNPFIMAQSFNSGKPITKGKLKLNSSMSYNYAIPRKNKVKVNIKDGNYNYQKLNEETEYYDKRFETIESNPTLKEFHNLLMEVNQKIYDTMPLEVREKFSAYSIPALKKNLIEILFDKNLSLLQRISKAAREIYDRIRALFGINEQDNLSYANVDPITGKPEYRVNSAFLKSNRQEIDRRYNIELMRLKKAMGVPLSTSIKKYDTYDLTKLNGEVISILAENLGVDANITAIKNKLNNEDLETAELGKILKNAITHQVVENNSFDLPKILKLYSYLTMEYAARQEVLPTIEMMKRHYENIKRPAETGTGKSIINANTNKTRLEGERINANKQMNAWFERVVLGNYGSKSEFGDGKIKRVGKLGVTGNDKVDRLTKKLQTTVTGKIYDTEEKIMVAKLDALIEDVTTNLKNTTNKEEIEELTKNLSYLQKMKDKLGKDFSTVASMDAMFNFIRFKGLGWNLSSYVTNFMEGQIANMTIAATGDYFTPENIYRANDIVKGSFLKNISFGKVATPGAKKARVLMDRYRILQDASNELQKASTKSAFSSFKNLSPYEGTRRTEYLNQTPLMIAVLLDTNIVGKDGQQSNVWDAMNADGTFKEEFRTEENIKNWEQADGKSYNDFASHMKKMIVNAHGDYDELRGIMASEYISGKAFLMFKRWMARQLYQRFAVTPQNDLEVGMRDYRGRYLSHTKTSGMLHGAIVGFGGLGLLGAGATGILIGGTAGLLLGKFYGSNSGLNFLQELAFTSKELGMNLMRIPVNNITGKQTIKSTNYDKLVDSDLSERDIKNFKANLIDMSLTLSWVAMILFTKALLWDDEDEEDDARRKAHNLLVNRFMQLSSQASMYVDPVDTYENTLGKLPVINFLNDVRKTAVETQDFLEGRDILASGPNAGESAFYNQFQKTFFPGILKSNLGFESHMSRQFETSPFDKWFTGDEKEAQTKARSMRAEYRKELKNEGLEDEEIRKKVDEKYRPKKKDEKYIDLIQEYIE